MNSKLLSAFLITTLSTTFACQQEEPPELPPVSSLTANLEGPESAPTMAKNADLELEGDYRNFANAWARVKIVQLYAAGIILVPSAVIGAALSQEPTEDGEDWVWSITALGATAELVVSLGLVDGWDVDLYISNAELERYHWVEGNFATDLSAGTWVARDPDLPAGEDAVLEISWTHTSETEHSLTYTNVSTSHDNYQDFIRYSRSGQTATLVYEDADDADLVADISWDTQTYAGSIEVPLYNEGKRACWDEDFVNAACD